MIDDSFIYTVLPQRVLFGHGRRHDLIAELTGSGAQSVFVVAGHSTASEVRAIFARESELTVTVWTDVAQHVPDTLAARARREVDELSPDHVVCVGGGSAIGLAKAIALSHRLPILAVPTTYSGSEQTTIYGITGAGSKQTGSDPVVQPRTVIYDPELTRDLPLAVTGASAFNALAHSVEALYAPGHNPVITTLALEGVRQIATALPRVMVRPDDAGARAALQYGAYLSGVALGATAADLHHKICHVLGGRFGLVHADAHSVVLPHVVSYWSVERPIELAALAGALGVATEPAAALWDLAVHSFAPTSLGELGITRADLDEPARLVAQQLPTVTAEDVLAILQRAFAGGRPSG